MSQRDDLRIARGEVTRGREVHFDGHARCGLCRALQKPSTSHRTCDHRSGEDPCRAQASEVGDGEEAEAFREMGVRNLEEFNERDKDESVRGKGEVVHDDEPPVRDESASGAAPKTLPAIVLVLDDLTDVAASDRKTVGRDLNRLLCLGCPAGIYVIASAKNPSGKLIGYDTTCNFQSRLTFKTATAEDSANAIGVGFAANLEAGGALLFKAWKRPLMFAKGVAIFRRRDSPRRGYRRI